MLKTFIFSALIGFFASGGAQAAGKPYVSCQSPPSDGVSVPSSFWGRLPACGASDLRAVRLPSVISYSGGPNPIRSVVLPLVASQAFDLPNGSKVDLSAELHSLLISVVSKSGQFSPLDPMASYPYQTHLELRAAVSSFEMNIGQVGVSFGFSPSGVVSLGSVASITGQVNSTIGSIGMTFTIFECVGTGESMVCTGKASATADHTTTGINMSVPINFGSVTTGPSFFYNTPLSGIFKAIIKDGINKLSRSPLLDQLPWFAHVRQYSSEAGSLIFDAGSLARLAPNQMFDIYAPTDGDILPYQRVAVVHTTAVYGTGSTAQVDQTTDSRGILVGDVVMIHRGPN